MPIDTFFKEFEIPELVAGLEHIITDKGGRKLSESNFKRFIPVMGISVLNESTEPILVFINETRDNSFRLAGNSSRTLTGVPAWNVTVQNLGTTTIAEGDIHVTLFNDLEQVSRYNAYHKVRRTY